MRSPLLALLAGALITAVGPPTAAQSIVEQTWAFKDGAPQTPNAFVQTSDGHLWIGTQGGLFRFDGTRFELFRSPFGDRLQSTTVSALLAADDAVWVGYLFGGFSVVQGGTVRNHVGTAGIVTGFARDRNGVVWARRRQGHRSGRPARRRDRHYGLNGVRERAGVIGAKLVLRSDPGAGTEVSLSMPASADARRRRWWQSRATETP